jgi:spermidine/putrescine transport system substrate-binding protein
MKCLSLLLRAAVVAAMCGVASVAGAQEKVLKLFIWEEYMDSEVLAEFTKETGIKVVEDNYDSVESMLAKVTGGKSGYDLVVPADYGVQILAKRGLLAELDQGKLKNLGNLDPKLKGLPFDPAGKFAVPYMRGTSGIAFNKKKVKNPPTKWADLFDPAKLAGWKGRISMLDDGRELGAAALLALGHDPNTTDRALIAAAEKLLQAQKPFLAKYDSASAEDSVASEETWIAQAFSGDVAVAQAENPDISYLIPEEGCTFFVDCFAILAESKRVAEAHQLIDFLLRPDIALKNVNSTRYASACAAIKPDEIEPSILESASFVPLREGKMFSMIDLGEEIGEVYEKLWTGLKD